MSNGNHEPQNQGNYQQPPPPPQDYGQQPHYNPVPPSAPKKSSMMPIAIIVIIIVVIAAIGGAFLMNGSKQKSPESTFEAFFDAMNSGNAEKALSLTDAHFLPASDFDDAVDEFDESGEEDYEYKLISTHVTYKEDMSSDERDEFESNIEDMEDELDIKVDDYAIVSYEIEAEIDGETETQDGEMPCIKVDGKWYLCMYFYMSMSGSSSSSTPVGYWVSTEKIDSDTAKLTYGSFSSDVQPKDVSVILELPDGTTSMLRVNGDLASSSTIMIGAPAGVTATYTDLNWEGNTANAGDYITLDGLTQTGVYTVTMFHLPSDAIIMGGEDTFQM